jgi:Domain of unknown function (DUF6259)
MEKTLSTKNASVVFEDNPIYIRSIFNYQDSTNVCANARQSILLRTPDAVSDPILLTEISEINFKQNEISFLLSDETKKFCAQLKISSDKDGIKFKVKISSSEPLWLAEWKLSGFDFQEVIVPALGGQSLSSDMPSGITLSYKYPFWWNAQFVLGKTNNGGVILRSKDVEPQLRLLRVGKEQKTFSLTYGIEANAPLKNNTELEAEWYLDCFNGDWKNAVEIHREWLEENFDLKSYNQHQNFPEWAEDINFVLELWGARKNYEGANHTFAQMIERLEYWKKFHSPENTLVYLPGFAENGVDSHAPDYNPSEQCGGESEFKHLVNHAHSLGYKVMIHTNVLAMTYTHPLYKEFKKHQVVDVFGREQGWAMDIDGDWLTEPYFAYINPGAKEWSNLMGKIIGDLIEKFDIDAVFLDQTLLAFNVSSGPNFLTGMRDHIKRLQNKFPNILFAGEGLHEQVIEALPMVQIHGIDSISEVHGMDGRTSWRNAHPVSTYLFGKYARYTAHLLTKHPSDPMFELQETSYEKLGVIPALCLYNHKQEMDIPAVHKMIKRAKRLNQERGVNEEN